MSNTNSQTLEAVMELLVCESNRVIALQEQVKALTRALPKIRHQVVLIKNRLNQEQLHATEVAADFAIEAIDAALSQVPAQKEQQ